MITTDVPDEVLLWVMRDQTKTAILGSVRETGVIYLKWDTTRAGTLINRTHHTDLVEHANEWLKNATGRLEREGYAFACRPQVLLMAGPPPERSGLGFWVEHTVRRYVENELAARA
jgi:hypothetical protein